MGSWEPGPAESHLEVIKNVRGGKGGWEEVSGRKRKRRKGVAVGDREQPHLLPNILMPLVHCNKSMLMTTTFKVKVNSQQTEHLEIRCCFQIM